MAGVAGRSGRKRRSEQERRLSGENKRDRARRRQEKAAREASDKLSLSDRPGFVRLTKRQLDAICKCLPGYNPTPHDKSITFDPKAANKAIEFFETQLCHVKGELARTPFKLERWERAIVANLFGWKRADGTRRYREALIYVPRKNGKTALCGALITYVLFEDGEPGAEIYGAAKEYKQAAKVFEHARGMVLQNEALKARCKVYSGQDKKIVMQDDFSTYQVISSDAGSAHGGHIHLAVVDELHNQPTGELVEVLETGTGSRRQPLLICITTSDYERPDSICNEKHDYAKAVCASSRRDYSGEVIEDDSFLPVIYEATLEDDWSDPKVWRKANPNFGVSVKPDYFQRKYDKARQLPSFENTFKRLHLNIRTQQDVRFIPMEDWAECGGKVDEESLRGIPCFGGLDLASTSDLTAFVRLWEVDGIYTAIPTFWVPEQKILELEQQGKNTYRIWQREGLLRTTPGNMTDYGTVRRDINDIANDSMIQEIAVDRLYQGAQLACELMADGFEVIAFGQGFMQMAAPTLAFETIIRGHRLQHGDNAILTWMAGNMMVELDAAGNKKPTKKNSKGKIDGIVALIMALGRAMVSDGGGSVYDTRGALSVEF